MCGLLAWALSRLSLSWRLGLAVSVEALWEVIENTNVIIERYRSVTMALGYEGDSIANSLGDILSFGIGFGLARRVGWRISIAIFVLTELILVVWIKDSLLLNVVMLIYPMEAIKNWQLGQ